MANLGTALSNFADDFLCALLQSQSDWNDFVGGAVTALPGAGPLPTTGYEFPYDLALGAACRLGRTPGNPDFDNPSIPAPGNCPVLYFVEQPYSYKFQNIPDTAIATSTLSGPISNIGYSTPAAGGLFFTADTGNGPQTFGNRGGVGWSEIILGTPTFTRQDGGIDNCSTPPVGTNNPPSGGGSVDYEPLPGGPTLTIPVGIVALTPIININGELTIPLQIDLGGVTISLSKNFNTGDINIGNPDDGCCVPPINELPQINDPEAPPPPGTNPVSITGLFLSSVVSDEANVTRFAGTYGPELFVPRLATVRFAHQIGGRRAWSAKLDVTSLRQYVPVPSPGFAYDFVIISTPGVVCTGIPATISQ